MNIVPEHESIIGDYLNKCEVLDFEFNSIKSIVKYLNREIHVHELKNDVIRNRDDAYNAILKWNERVQNLNKHIASFRPHYPDLPLIDHYIVQLKND